MTGFGAEIGTRLRERRALVGIVGLGYVGLPLALAALQAGFPVLGFDVDPGRVAALNRGEGAFHHIPGDALAEARAAGTFAATGDMARLGEPDAVLICVPTPLTRHREPDLSYVEATARAIAAALRPGQLVVLESTTWPGTTAEVMRPILEAGGLRVGHDVFLAYSPEREDPGNPAFDTARIPKVVGADDPVSAELAQTLYGALTVETVPVSSAAAAEAVKLTENIFRSVNIALVNELKLVYDAMGIDVWEVIGAAATKPFGFMPFWPGPGLGGHCIPIDPFYLAWKAREFDVPARFIELAGEVNTRMPHHVVERLAAALDGRGRTVSGSTVLVLGLAYKRNIDDTRESPSLRLIRLVEARGARALYHDPLVPVLPPTREHPDLTGRRSVPLTPETLAAADAVLVATDHDGVDYALVAAHAPLVVDTRNVMARNGLTGAHIVKA
ncbi:nucleotide sugar dehydrogenase [Methylobacterium oryzihabitans]|uniref:Nucleotide sugar dehydrogenase n=1 Tax=Methylobacterium oryzihabitans TaxID=2499852 RepID=A0A3S2VZS9_9HYPH|nr:nucleotide sugar dehydrogenase [Methylobacterium oryzihabitans]RVU21642.1 nucleotide sugar dehydrogenase [Methylobacterium oryzihabitans]